MSPRYVKALAEAQNNNCCYCHYDMPYQTRLQTIRNRPTKDHLVPRCHGGPTNPENLVMACAQCNEIRGAMDAEVFYQLLWHWFTKDEGLRSRWHSISRSEFSRFKQECSRIHTVQWERRLKICIAARECNRSVPLPFLRALDSSQT